MISLSSFCDAVVSSSLVPEPSPSSASAVDSAIVQRVRVRVCVRVRVRVCARVRDQKVLSWCGGRTRK